MDSYLDTVDRLPLIDRDEELALCHQYAATREPRLRDRLMRAHLRLVVSIAREYAARADLSDLVQEGNLGLLRAIDRFDPDRGVRLSSYAGWWIRAFIVKFIIDNVRLVPSTRTREGRRSFWRGELPHAEISLDAAVGEGEPLSERLGAAEDTRPDVETESAEAKRLLNQLLGEVLGGETDARTRAIVNERWLVDEPVPLVDLGRRFHVTKERMRQIEQGLMGRLRSRVGKGGLQHLAA